MAKTWNEPIDKTVDWGGDESTGNLPVSGAMVQKFIKDTLAGKAGVFYFDTSNNRYIVFADIAAQEAYLADPSQVELILGTFDAPSNYFAEITLATPTYNAVMSGVSGNYVEFTFDIKNKNGASTGEDVTVTYTFTRNSAKQVVTERRRAGENVRFNVDRYLGEGTNNLVIGIVGQTSLAATTVAVTYQVVSLALSDSYDISKVYDIRQGAKTLAVPFTISGYGTKIMEWYIDGVKLDFVKADDEIVDLVGTKTKYITVSNLQQGHHSLQFRAYTTVDGDRFFTDTYYRDFMVYTGANTSPILAVSAVIPKERGVLGAADTLSLYGLSQYVPYTLKFAAYSPTNAASMPVAIAIDGALQGTVEAVNGQANSFTFTPESGGDKVISLSTGGVTYSISAIISGTSTDIEDITSGLTLAFDAAGKSNNSSDRNSWTDGKYHGTLSGFNYNLTSGWVDGRLEMNAGSSFEIDYAPLSGSPTETGKTVEIEWSSKNVSNDDAVICDLRNSSGTGILITATKVSLMSANGVVVETEYKADENVRVGFVINKAEGVTNQHISFIYANGIVSRAETWGAGDSYTSNALLKFVATSEAQVSLKAIRVYDMALTSDQMLNNYTMYRDNVAEMMDIYDRNDVYVDGTTTFSPEKMMSRLPVMIVTGDIPTLENTSDKDTQIIVDIEYTNLQDPTRNFKMKNAAMRPQGTSSMGYPKKNFRIYTRKNDDTILYDANDKVVASKLYSFKAGAQPVDCWCLKADYAESSGTHNTGIARLWNKALYDARVTYSFGDGDPRNINDETVLRTQAQRAAVQNNYGYDVRTTIDGFPILMFYRRSANDPLIFIGKYNFNNDKSTESVFGFVGIPGFDNSRMQCWEVLNNGNALALFQTVSGFDSGWSEAFEARYPDKSTNTADLKAFCTWMTNVSASAFATEKWQHLDVFKMAAYWVYLMRHAAADQFVKNAMFTSEDGEKWYYILYDNDTINGLINTGRLRIQPTDGRQTTDATGSYVFAGHDSRLWNMLEADQEFMSIVSAVDNALYSAGISYANTIKIFDDEQADKWVERVYNQDAQYKYIGPYADAGVNNLFMLQGKRDLHRKWWLAKRFAIYDAKYVSGTYKSQSVEVKCINGTPAGQQFTIKAGADLDYGYGINNVPRSFGITLEAGQSHTFSTSEVVNLGDPIRIYGAPNIAELDFSPMAEKLAVVTVANAYDSAIGTKMTKMIFGRSGATNAEVTEISGLKQLSQLEYLDIQGMTKMTSIDLSSHPRLKTLKAAGSGIASAVFAKGAPVERLELPAAMRVISLEQLPYLTAQNVVLENLANVSSITVKSCPNISNDFAWIKTWYDAKNTIDAQCTLVMDNVNWTNVSPEELLAIAGIGKIELKGKVTLSSITLEQIEVLVKVFGESAFDKNADLYISAPFAAFIVGRTQILEGESEKYSAIVTGAEVKGVVWNIISGGNSYVSLDQTGLLTVSGGYGVGNITIRATVDTNQGYIAKDLTIAVKVIVYPEQATSSIQGPDILDEQYGQYDLSYSPSVTGEVSAVWSLSGANGFAVLASSDNTSCVIHKVSEPAVFVACVISCEVKKAENSESLFTLSKEIQIFNSNIAETDEVVCSIFHDKGLCANLTYMTKDEAAAITNAQFPSFSGQGIKTFNGLQYFTGLTDLPDRTFNGCASMESITFPPNISRLPMYCFYQCTALKNIIIPKTITDLSARSLFVECSSLTSMTFHAGITNLGEAMFQRCTNLREVNLLGNVTYLGNYFIESCKNLSTLLINAPVAPSLGYNPFGAGSGTAGYNTRNENNTLYVPASATGYEAEGWTKWLCNKDYGGFTISKTL